MTTEDTSLRIAPNHVVSLRYSLKNSQGEILESNWNTAPVRYLYGTGHIHPELEAALVGLKAGDEKSVSLTKAHYPELDDDFIFEIVIDEVRPATEAEQQRGYAFPATNNDGGLSYF